MLLIAAVVLLAAALWLGVSLLQREGAYVLVSVDGEQQGRYPLSGDAEIEIRSKEHYNLLVIKNGAASVTEADCPDKLCVNMGEIRYNGQSIICLPHKTVVEIIGGKSGREDVTAR